MAPRWPANEDRVKAIQFSQFGGPEVLELVEVPDPHPAPGHIRVAVRAVGVNPMDWKLRSGIRGGDLPQRTGGEVAGVVDEFGDGITDVAVGDRVFGFAAGFDGAAELALSAEYAPIPPSLDFAGAAGLPVAVETAVRTLDLVGVGAESTVVINGAAGAVGSSAVQIAVARSALVIGTASPATTTTCARSAQSRQRTARDWRSDSASSHPTASTPPSTRRAPARSPRSSS